ncbi:hypothetical protein GFY24_40465 [Nocardia sp. SYP-A9097]|uniref:hypothetical protein n=1 Tax=Nocardia sp. SYP-A9097 TaxID=2663237 RepID=UPI00129B9FBD|nr:hypothetical protein [Nocardia sp. SYP-A9097]MRH93598.1 hypothetical protein [Nocardia sp. SYP-A9097]
MSTVILKGRLAGIDPAAETWLAATSLASDRDAALRLSRAVDPARYGIGKRDRLDLSRLDQEMSERVVRLLIAGQVPTPAALGAAEICQPTMAIDATCTLHRAESKQLQRLVRADADTLGDELACMIGEHWAAHDIGPTWQEVWHSEACIQWWDHACGELPEFRIGANPTFVMLERLGWIASNRSSRSLCTGRRFHTRFFRDHVSGASPATIGYLLARQVGIHRRLHGGHGPQWAQIADTLTDTKGVPLFFNAHDGRAQQRWLITQRWIRVQDNQLRRGDRAKTETRRRAGLRKRTNTIIPAA